MRSLILLVILVLSISTVSAQAVENGWGNVHISEQSDKAGQDGKVQIMQDQRISELLLKHADMNKQHKGISGYRIQIYSGSGNRARKESQNVRAQFLKIFPNIDVSIVYNEPYYKTRVGNFRNKTEGYKIYKAISKHFPSCYFVIESEMEYPKLD
jgi:hypothetical protein